MQGCEGRAHAAQEESVAQTQFGADKVVALRAMQSRIPSDAETATPTSAAPPTSPAVKKSRAQRILSEVSGKDGLSSSSSSSDDEQHDAPVVFNLRCASSSTTDAEGRPNRGTTTTSHENSDGWADQCIGSVSNRIGGLTIKPHATSLSSKGSISSISVDISVELDVERIGGLTTNDRSESGGNLSLSSQGGGERSDTVIAGRALAPASSRAAALEGLEYDRGANVPPPVLHPMSSDLVSNAPDCVGKAPANRCCRPLCSPPLPVVSMSSDPGYARSARPSSARDTAPRQNSAREAPIRPRSAEPDRPRKLTAVLARLASLDDDEFHTPNEG